MRGNLRLLERRRSLCALTCFGTSVLSHRAETKHADCPRKQAATQAAPDPTFLPPPASRRASPPEVLVSVFSWDSSLAGTSSTTGRHSGCFPVSRLSQFSSVAGSPEAPGYLGSVPQFSPLTPSFLSKSSSPSNRRSQRSYLSPSDPSLHP